MRGDVSIRVTGQAGRLVGKVQACEVQRHTRYELMNVDSGADTRDGHAA